MSDRRLTISPAILLPYLLICLLFAQVGYCNEPLDAGSRRQLFVDDYLIESMENLELRLQRPIPREIVLVHDQPWEGSGCGYHTIFRDGPVVRMYYKAWHLSPQPNRLEITHPTYGAYAESKDGIHWIKPDLGLFEFAQSKHNNIVWMGPGSHDFTPFRDTNPDCRADERYKAVGNAGGVGRGLLAFKSSDGIHWSRLQQEPIITKGAFDTQNLAFWDAANGLYRAYIRGFHPGGENGGPGIRDIRMATSKDFRHWTEPERLKYPGVPDEPLYTNQIAPYYRAPNLLIGFPTRYLERSWSESLERLPQVEHRKLRSASAQRYGTAVTEGLFMSSRDGLTFRRWREAFLPAGTGHRENWKYGDNYIAWHLIETRASEPGAPPELSLYASEDYWTGSSSRLRRYTLRLDGFVALHAGGRAGTCLTRPLTFDGDRLSINFRTSAAGSVQIEIDDLNGKPIEGFRSSECSPLFGDDVDRIVTWSSGRLAKEVAGRPVRLRFDLFDADLFSWQFSTR